MSRTETPTTTIPPEALRELEEAIDRALRGVRDPEAMRQAAERMDRTREEIYRRVGLLDFAVPAIRDLRDGKDA